MTTKETGGPAFPPLHDPNTHVYGMDLRDYFAAEALKGLMRRDWSQYSGTDESLAVQWSKSAYDVADQMLEARK